MYKKRLVCVIIGIDVGIEYAVDDWDVCDCGWRM